MWIALFPLIYPITCATEYFGGITPENGGAKIDHSAAG